MTDLSELQILAVGLQGGDGHEHVTHLQWQRASSVGITSAEALVAWLQEGSENHAWLESGGARVPVEVFTPIDGSPYLRARSGEGWSEHLLALRRF